MLACCFVLRIDNLAFLLGQQYLSFVQDPTQPSAFFISGSGGTGKTTVYEILLASVRSQHRGGLQSPPLASQRYCWMGAT